MGNHKCSPPDLSATYPNPEMLGRGDRAPMVCSRVEVFGRGDFASMIDVV